MAEQKKEGWNILTGDLLVVDSLLKLPNEAELAALPDATRDRYARLGEVMTRLLAARGLKTGDKISINAEEFRAISEAIAGLPAQVEAAGSTADIVTTYRHLLEGKPKVDYAGVVGGDSFSDNIIAEDLQRNGITLAPGVSQDTHAAVSFVFAHPDGRYTHITYPGNAAEKLTPEAITNQRIAASDAVLVPISLWSKFNGALPDALMQKALKQDKPVILCMPFQARFDYGKPQGQMYAQAIPNADVIVADESELKRKYGVSDTQEAITRLEADMARHDTLRKEAGRAPRAHPATALIKHADDSVTVLVAATAQSAPEHNHLPAPQVLQGKKHSLGVDDAIYAGFIAALSKGMQPPKAAEYALSVGQTKFLYESPRIPNPATADAATRARWKHLQSGLGSTIENVSNVLALGKTGVENVVDPARPRTAGQKAFDFFVYPFFANIGVLLLSIFFTYHSSFNQNKSNFLVKRASKFKELLANLPVFKDSPKLVRTGNMLFWSFFDGSVLMPFVAYFESKRQQISQFFDKICGTEPEDKSVYSTDVKRSWKDVLWARASSFVMVFATYFTLNVKLFPNSQSEGILSETALNSGIFKRETVQSINGVLFDIPGKVIGEWLAGFKRINEWAKKLSGGQLAKMAQAQKTVARAATDADARYQLEGLANTTMFELVYTAITTTGLYVFGKLFGARRQHAEEERAAQVQQAMRPQDIADTSDMPASAASKVLQQAKPASRAEALERRRMNSAQYHLAAH